MMAMFDVSIDTSSPEILTKPSPSPTPSEEGMCNCNNALTSCHDLVPTTLLVSV